MKHFRSLTALLLALMLLLVPFAGVLADEEPETASWDQLPLGISGYAISAPAGFVDLGVTDEEYAAGLVSVYYNPLCAVEQIEISQFPAEEQGFEAFAQAKYAAYEGRDYAYNENFNGLKGAGFLSESAKEDGSSVNCASVFFDCGEIYIGIDYNWSPEAEGVEELLAQINGTLGKAKTMAVRLGSSPYYVTLPAGYYSGDVDAEERAAGLVTYYLNDNLLFDFDIYEIDAFEDITLVDAAMQLCAANGGSDLTLNEVNGVPVYTFNGTSVYDDVEYDTVTAVLDSTNGTFIGIICWLDDNAMRDAALGMLSTIATAEDMIPDEPMVLRIGSSSLCITLPTTFAQGYISEEEFNEKGYAACYYSPYALYDIDFYQCAIMSEEPTLAEFTEKDAAAYNGTEIALDEEINGVRVTSYRSDETYDGIDYRCVTYTFEEGEYYYQLCFSWTDNDAEEDVEAVMETLAPYEMTTMRLGRSDYSVTVPAGMETTDVEYDDEPGLEATLYKKGSLKFIVYDMIAEGANYTLEEYGTMEAQYYGGKDLTFTEYNGVPVATYVYKRTNAELDHCAILTLCLKYGETSYIGVDFYVDDYVSGLQAAEIIYSITAAQ